MTFPTMRNPAQLQVKPLPVDAFLNEVVALYEGGSADARDASWARPGLLSRPIRCDLRQVMHNLLKNALEAAGEQGRIVVSSRVGEEEGNNFVEIAVSDNGPGFDPELIGQVFEPYVTSKTKGTGLGLAIVKRIVAEHGGVIHADNPATGGGRVVLRLPADGAGVRAATASSASRLPPRKGKAR